MKPAFATLALVAVPVVALGGCANDSATNSSSSTSTTPSSSNAQTLSAPLNSADGKHVADATIDFADGYATVTVEAAADSGLAPGFHGLHIHAVGSCEANSSPPGGGPSGDFASAGEHFQAPGHTGQPASGDLPPLLVRSNGAGKLVATSDAFTEDQLKSAQGSSIVLHESADMGGGPSAAAEQRIACGVLSPASATSTSVSTSVSTSTVTTSAAPVVPPATVTETTTPTSSATTTEPSTTSATTSTSTVTVTESSTTTPSSPGPNG
jgi:Cu-Zn family superoxide dismutase